jgi:hypothetical protein
MAARRTLELKTRQRQELLTFGEVIEESQSSQNTLFQALQKPRVSIIYARLNSRVSGSEPFDGDVVAEASAPVHADGHSMRAEHASEVLVPGVEPLRIQWFVEPCCCL